MPISVDSLSYVNLSACLLNIKSLTNLKTNFVYDKITDSKLNFFALTEIWGVDSINSIRALATPSSYTFFNKCRANRRGGGVGIICSNSHSPCVMNLGAFNTFECIGISLKNPNVNIVVIYRTGPCTSDFFDDFSDLIVSLSALSASFLILGDFNIHMNKNTHASNTLSEIIEIFALKQHVNSPTHRLGNTLDLIISSFELNSLSISDPSSPVSDHFSLNFTFSLPLSSIKNKCRKTVQFRKTSEINITEFTADISESLSNLNEPLLDNYVNSFNTKLMTCLDLHAPLISKNVLCRPNTEFYNDNLRELKRNRRRFERILTRAKSNNENIAQAQRDFDHSSTVYFNTIRTTRETFSLNKINEANGDPKALFKLSRKLTNTSTGPDCEVSPDNLSKFFSEKVERIRSDISATDSFDIPPRSVPIPLNELPLTSEDEISELIKSCKKTSSPLDPFPSKLYASILPSILLYLLTIFNLSLSSGNFPSPFKQAAVIPILKKIGAKLTDPANFRPISLLPFLSKILERLIDKRIRDHIKICNADELLQSGYKKFCSTETALLKVTNDLRRAADKGKVTILLMLDLSAAFDTLDHSILLNRLRTYLGISGSALSWFQSYLSSRSQTVFVNGKKSSVSHAKYGVPQGSVLGPLLFQIYLLPLGILLRQLGFSFHCYADDTQIYLTFTLNSMPRQIQLLRDGYAIINSFLSSNFLKLNPDKSEVILIGTPDLVSQCKSTTPSINLGNVDINFSENVKNLGVLFDESLGFRNHIKSVSKKSFLILRNFRSIRNHFSKAGFETLMHAFVTTRVDYCNALYTGLPSISLRPLQLVQNYAARLILKKNRFSRATPLLIELHWLPISKRIDFKILLITYKCNNNLAPEYLTSLLKPLDNNRDLRSSDDPTLLDYDRTELVSMGDRAFSVYAPKLWNSVPREIREAPSVSIFKSRLKTYLFSIHFSDSL